MTTTHTIYREVSVNGNDCEKEFNLEIEFVISGGSRGARDEICGKRGAGPPLEPDEDPELEIISITDQDGLEVEPTDRELDEIYEACWISAAMDGDY